MLRTVVNKACKELRCIDQAGKAVGIKLDNSAYMGVRKLYTDQIANTVDKRITAGSILTLPCTGDKHIVGTLTTDYYQGEFLRNVLDLVETNNTVSVSRITHTPSPQGGVGTKVEEIIYTDLPVKIWNNTLRVDKKNDIMTEQMGMLLSTLYPVKRGDVLTFGSYYEPAKVEGIKHNFEGFFEIIFDKDPRWR